MASAEPSSVDAYVARVRRSEETKAQNKKESAKALMELNKAVDKENEEAFDKLDVKEKKAARRKLFWGSSALVGEFFRLHFLPLIILITAFYVVWVGVAINSSPIPISTVTFEGNTSFLPPPKVTLLRIARPSVLGGDPTIEAAASGSAWTGLETVCAIDRMCYVNLESR
jgi:hypothetical protein